MRICLVTREYPPATSYTGGIGTHLSVLGPALADRGHQISVVLPFDGRGVVPDHRGLGFHRLPFPRLGPLWMAVDPIWSARVRAGIERLGPFDVVLAPEWGGDAWAYSRGMRSGPLITHLTTSLEQVIAMDPEFSRGRRVRAQHATQRWLERRQTERSDALIAVSRAILEWTGELWDISALPARVLPNPADLARIRRLGRREPPDRLRLPSDGPRVVFSGRLEIRKGVDVLVEAMLAVWERIPEAHLVLAGHDGRGADGPMSARLRRIAGRRSDHLLILGNLEHDSLFPLLSSADAVALPSRWEASGNAAVEAMALGCACVLTTGSGFGEYCEHGRDGLLVPPGDPEALGAAIVQLLEAPDLRARLGSSAAERAEEFNPSRVLPRWIEYFAEISGRETGEAL